MTTKSLAPAPEHTAVRVALWRALHVLIDSPPPIFVDQLGAKIVGEPDWQNRGDMNPDFSKSMRASIVGRARFVEDLVLEQINSGIEQYVIMGAGLDTFAQRHPELLEKIHVFEIDQPGPQAWKIQRLKELNMPIPDHLHFVPVDFESKQSWQTQLLNYGFDQKKPAVLISTGVSMYLSKEANAKLLQEISTLAPASTFAMTFMLALDLLDAKERSIMEFVMKRAAESGTPFLSLFSPEEILELARESSGFKKAHYVSAQDIYNRYFKDRTDNLNAGTAECFLVVAT